MCFVFFLRNDIEGKSFSLNLQNKISFEGQALNEYHGYLNWPIRHKNNFIISLYIFYMHSQQ